MSKQKGYTHVENQLYFYQNFSVPGIYQLTIDGKRYIGSSVNIYRRFEIWKGLFFMGKIQNRKLREVINKHKFIQVDILEECPRDKKILIQREQFYLDTLKPELNLSPSAKTNKGYKHTDESKKKYSDYQKRRVSEMPKEKLMDHILLMNLRRKEKGVRQETRNKLSKVHKGKTGPSRKIQESDVIEILKMLKEGISPRIISKRYGICGSLVSQIKLNKAWTRVSR
jgi:group I intron endonuclease